MKNITDELNKLVCTLKEKVGIPEEIIDDPLSEIITAVTLELYKGYYTVSTYTGSERQYCRTRSFSKSEIIQVISEFIRCEEFIGKTDKEYMLCRG